MLPSQQQQGRGQRSSMSAAAPPPLNVEVPLGPSSDNEGPPSLPTMSSPFRQDRFNHETRREALERRKQQYGKKISPQDQQNQDVQFQYSNEGFDEEKKCDSFRTADAVTATADSFRRGSTQPQHLMTDTTTCTMEPPKLKRRFSPHHAHHHHHHDDTANLEMHRSNDTTGTTSKSRKNDIQYYRVVYRGVVALLSQPDPTSARSGCYLSYGEVVASRYQIPIENNNSNNNTDDTSTRNGNAPSRVAIRVDEVLTGGYAFDPPNYHKNNNNNNPLVDTSGATDSETPKKSNVIQGYAATTTTNNNMHASSHNDLPIMSPVMVAISRSLSSDSSTASSDFDDDHALQLSPSTTEAILRSFSGGSGKTATAADDEQTEDSNTMSHLGFIISHNSNNNKAKAIVQLLSEKPQCEHGRFFYKVVSTTPLPILSAPSTDAPLSKAMVLPGTVHEVSFRMFITDNDAVAAGNGSGDEKDRVTDTGIWFLRLTRRKGYLASRRIGTGVSRYYRYHNRQAEVVVKDVTEEILSQGDTIESQSTDGIISKSTDNSTGMSSSAANVSVLSVLSTAIPCAMAANNPKRRHRPPRRRQETSNEDLRHHGISSVTARNCAQNSNNVRSNNNSLHDTTNTTSTTITNLSIQSQPSDRLPTPSSNVSLLSDDESMDNQNQYTSFSSSHHDRHHHAGGMQGALSPDRSVARSVKSQHSSQQHPQYPTYFLMRVTAPRGLRILDAPHFQVNNLIHGTQQSATGATPSVTLTANNISRASTPVSDISAISGLNSTKNNHHHLFHTMAGRITTTNGITTADNAMIFDSVTKTRILPRGAVFEASKRMETSEAALFHHQGGAGLIKLADNSGWVIVPHSKELEHQYKTFHGGVGANGMKEGEATNRGYEEIGNAIVFPKHNNDHIILQKTYSSDVWMRVAARSGANVVCAPPVPDFNDASPSSSPSSSANPKQDQLAVGKSDSTSDVASSVGSSFLDAMFRAPKRSDTSDQGEHKKDPCVAPVEKQMHASTTIVSFVFVYHLYIMIKPTLRELTLCFRCSCVSALRGLCAG